MRHYLFTNKNTIEEVPEFVADNWQDALDDDGEPRYNGDMFFIRDDGSLTVAIQNASKVQFSAIMRICRVDPLMGSSPNGLYDQPSHIPVKKRKSTFLFDTKTQQKYKKVA